MPVQDNRALRAIAIAIASATGAVATVLFTASVMSVMGAPTCKHALCTKTAAHAHTIVARKDLATNTTATNTTATQTPVGSKQAAILAPAVIEQPTVLEDIIIDNGKSKATAT